MADCSGCTTGCTEGCASSCQGCTGGCTTNCASGCTTACQGCTTSCAEGCTACDGCQGCTSNCTSSCDSGCTTSCAAGCTTGCTGSCTTGCTSSCASGCTTSCASDVCTGCTGGCTSGCTSSCASGCTNACASGCTNGCASTCASGCNSSCASGCTTGCTTGCTSSCQINVGCSACTNQCASGCTVSVVVCLEDCVSCQGCTMNVEAQQQVKMVFVNNDEIAKENINYNNNQSQRNTDEGIVTRVPDSTGPDCPYTACTGGVSGGYTLTDPRVPTPTETAPQDPSSTPTESPTQDEPTGGGTTVHVQPTNNYCSPCRGQNGGSSCSQNCTSGVSCGGCVASEVGVSCTVCTGPIVGIFDPGCAGCYNTCASNAVGAISGITLIKTITECESVTSETPDDLARECESATTDITIPCCVDLCVECNSCTGACYNTCTGCQTACNGCTTECVVNVGPTDIYITIKDPYTFVIDSRVYNPSLTNNIKDKNNGTYISPVTGSACGLALFSNTPSALTAGGFIKADTGEDDGIGWPVSRKN